VRVLITFGKIHEESTHHLPCLKGKTLQFKDQIER
jgi:hypothetical protein